MGDVIVGIHQPNFFPWFGYFLKIAKSDKFVFLDDVIIPNSSSYVNRTSININGEPKWITIPINKSQKSKKIISAKYSDTKWREKIIKTLQINYGSTPYYLQNQELIYNLLQFQNNSISKFNINVITKICKTLGLSTPFYYSSSYNIAENSTKRLIALIKQVEGNIYLSGEGGKKYQDVDLFHSSSIKLIFNNYNHPTYNQNNPKGFLSGLSILDLLFNIGVEEIKTFITHY